jgi:trehalose 6-phosphate synthase/phosphatase
LIRSTDVVAADSLRHQTTRVVARFPRDRGDAVSVPPLLPPGLAQTLSEAPALTVLLDYDGTLVPIAQTPELAAPGPEVLALVERVATRLRTSVHIVTGRPRETCERWFGDLQVDLWSEHGFWHRRRGVPWEAALPVAADWMDRVRPILEQVTASTPGSFIETKSVSAAWHYRLADAAFGEQQARELHRRLTDAVGDQPFDVLEGKKVIEIRPRGVSKALVAGRIVAAVTPGAANAIVAIGDDRTDEDMFGALPPSSVTIVVGTHPSRARYRVADPDEVRRFITIVCDGRSGPVSASRADGR